MDNLTDEMTIDPRITTNIIVDFIREKVMGQHCKGVALGLSGGIDSAVLASLASKAVGAKGVHAIYLCDRDSDEKFHNNAQVIAAKLGIEFEVMDISSAMEERDIYKPFLQRVSSISPGFNRLLLRIARFLYYRTIGEEPFIIHLRNGTTGDNGKRKSLHELSVGYFEKGFNERHRHRRQVLEEYAAERNLLSIGAANKTELHTGLFVKGGIDDLPLEPLLDLYKNQVVQLAAFLDIPREIIEESPSPDMFLGLTDEFIIGMPYHKIDRALYTLESDLWKMDETNTVIDHDDLDRIKTITELSAWKRAGIYEFPICSGS
jgi:NAD+ synthase